MDKPPQLAFSHVGIFVSDMARMEGFYTRLLGLTVTDRGRLGMSHGEAELVFLSRDPDEHHQIVLCSGRPADLPFNVINQLSFRVESLAGLRRMYERLQDQPVTDVTPVTHGNAISVYFRDPEGNRLELFVDTPWYVTQPLRAPIDLTLPDDELLAAVEAMVRELPGFKPHADWRAEMARRMGRA